ncbi:unnamed protein product [Rotaria sordida]|uniref:Uncharacterized protein n=1 Tax=Rotaria sordida TaxID=392033 RepID=A0A814XH66_9BILA|nr:unnamed protein product [Rotaria sordida]CAF3734814.1 unnamed protein product [Rotaria sordida]
MIPVTAVPPHSINTLDRVAFCKSVREKRKQLQLNHHTNGKDNISSSTENAFLTQMLQSSSISATSSSVSSSLNIPSLLRKGNLSSSPSSHRTATSTLTNILPALLNGTLQSPRTFSPYNTSTNIVTLNSPTSTNTTDTLVDIKCSTSLPVSPITHTFNNNNPPDTSNHSVNISPSCSPPRCRSYPMTALTKRSSPSRSTISPSESMPLTQSFPSSTSLLAPASSCPLLTTMNTTTTTTTAIISSTSPSPDDTTPKIVRSASVKSCASDSGVSSSSPLSDNNIVHVFRTNHIEPNNQPQISTGSRKRKSLAHFYDELNKDKKFSSETTVSSGFSMPTSTTTTNNNNNNNNIPYSQQEALAIGYAQYALMHTLTQQFRVNYPAALLHAAAASGYLPLPSPMMAAAAAAAVAAATSSNVNTNGNKISTTEKFRERRKVQPQPESDNNNNHIQSNDQPYRRETYQTLLESSRLLGQQQQQKLLKPVPIDLRKNNGTNRTNDNSPIPSNYRYSSSPSSTSSPSSPLCSNSPKSLNIESNNDYICIPKKLMPVIGARINDWLERNINFTLSLSIIRDTFDDNNKDKYLLLSRVWHRLLLTSMIENSFEIYVTKDLQITNDIPSLPTIIIHPTENDVKQIESLINRGKTLEIDEIGFNLIREMIIYKEGKTLFNNFNGNLFEKAECQTQTKLLTWCSTRVKYSKIVFFLCNIYQVKEDIFERLFCAGSMHQSTPIHTHIQRLLETSNSMDV